MQTLGDPSDALTEIHPHVTLEGIFTRELFCVREDVEEPDPVPRFALQVDLEDLEDLEEAAPRRVRFGLKLELETLDGRVRILLDGSYSVDRDHADSFTMPLAVEYMNHVAVMAMLPYMRQALADLTMRVLREEILMPVFGRGEVHFPPPEEDD